jgi:hypothetical protein
MRTVSCGIDKMTEIQRSGRFSSRTCGRRLNGFVQNSQERRSPYRPNLRSSFLAGRRFFCRSLHPFNLTRRLQFPAGTLRPSTLSGNSRLRCGKDIDIVPESPSNSRCFRSPRNRTILRENRSERRQECEALQGSAAGNLIQECIYNDGVYMQRGASLYSGDNILFFIFRFSFANLQRRLVVENLSYEPSN